MLPLRGMRSSLPADNSLSSVLLELVSRFGGSLASAACIDVDAHEVLARHTKRALRDAEFSASRIELPDTRMHAKNTVLQHVSCDADPLSERAIDC